MNDPLNELNKMIESEAAKRACVCNDNVTTAKPWVCPRHGMFFPNGVVIEYKDGSTVTIAKTDTEDRCRCAISQELHPGKTCNFCGKTYSWWKEPDTEVEVRVYGDAGRGYAWDCPHCDEMNFLEDDKTMHCHRCGRQSTPRKMEDRRNDESTDPVSNDVDNDLVLNDGTASDSAE